ncbi:MAG: hypothetical protein ACJA2W_002930 [Planctomycetota bacterium]|jgi:hypothetical protein
MKWRRGEEDRTVFKLAVDGSFRRPGSATYRNHLPHATRLDEEALLPRSVSRIAESE